MNKKLSITIGIIIALVILGAVFYFAKQESGPKLTDAERTRIEGYVRQMDEKLAKDPNDKFAYLDKADYLRQLGKNNQALATLQEAYAVNPAWKESVEFILEEARIHGQINTQDGIKRYEALIAVNPQKEEYYKEYISFLKRMKQPKAKILEYYDKAIANIKDTSLELEKRQYLEELGQTS